MPVANALGGTFDVEISGKVYWTNGVTPAIKACPSVECDLGEGGGCCEFFLSFFLGGFGSGGVERRGLICGGDSRALGRWGVAG